MKKFTRYLLLIYLFIPISVFAYSDYIMASGKNIGIELKSNNVIIVGSYNIDNYNVLIESDLKIGDKILKVNDYDITSAVSLQNAINKINASVVSITYKRSNKIYKTDIKLQKEDGEYKTGLYVRDSIRGVATLTYIDATNNTFGALGHEILERTTKEKFEIKDGKIFKSDVTGISRSEPGTAGEKNAQYNKNEVYGNINKNTISGIFGDYIDKFPYDTTLKVGTKDDVKEKEAIIRTVINENEIQEYKIKILKVNKNSDTKNILFEITDEQLLNKTGGVVQGMSGSPIIQDNLIVGAVTHVIVNDTKKGYGIFITTMLEESEK